MDTLADTPKRRNFKGIAPEERQRERREKLMEAGLEAYGTRGYHAVTVKEICAEAKLTERYFYESFKDREALFGAVYQRQIELLRDRLGSTISRHAPDPRAMARAALDEFFGLLQDDPRATRILFIDVMSVSPAVEQLSRQAISGWGQMLEQFTQLLFPDAHRGKLDPALIASGLVGACINMAMTWVFGGFRESRESVRDNCYAIFDALISAWSNNGPVKLPAKK